MKCLLETQQQEKKMLSERRRRRARLAWPLWELQTETLCGIKGAEVFHIYGVIGNVWPGSICLKELVGPHYSNRSLCSESAGLPALARVSGS